MAASDLTMSDGARTEIDARSVRSQRVRLVRRAGQGRLPFVPFGLIPVVGLALLMLFGMTAFAKGAIEDAVSRATRQALDGVGATWAMARVSGQWVVLEGRPPTVVDGLKAVKAVQDAQAKTIFGAAPPVTRVTDKFTWSGQVGVEPPVAKAARPTFTAAQPPPPATIANVARCEQTLAELLGRTQIQFATASAVIGRDSFAVLDSIAQAAGGCPGTLSIEGHTDSDGRVAFNNTLSRKRAEAVRAALMDRGVPGSRLVVVGYGAAKPIASNDTNEGRERNRRIEMRVAPPA